VSCWTDIAGRAVSGVPDDGQRPVGAIVAGCFAVICSETTVSEIAFSAEILGRRRLG
jgi:hypothetical protein